MTFSRTTIAALLVPIAFIALVAAACESEDPPPEPAPAAPAVADVQADDPPDPAPAEAAQAAPEAQAAPADDTAADDPPADDPPADDPPADDPPADDPPADDPPADDPPADDPPADDPPADDPPADDPPADDPPADDPPADDPPADDPPADDPPADDPPADDPPADDPPADPAPLADGSIVPPAPEVPDGPLDPRLASDLDLVFQIDGVDLDALARVGISGDARVAWLLSDVLRFLQVGETSDAAVLAFERLTGTDVPRGYAWPLVTNWLIAWDLPAPPDYVSWKRIFFEFVEPDWIPFFDDADADIDWRLLSWGGVFMDDRQPHQVDWPCVRGCIPAINDPAVTDAAGGDWYPDDRLVFGIVINGEARAYPKNIMEIHEMVNDTVGGRRIGMPYCTLCGSAQAYFTDRPPPGFQNIELRTSGLLSRSNKVMFDYNTMSVFDTFRGNAVSGPLQDENYVLEMLTVVTSTWGEWKAAYPDTTIVAADGGLGRFYPFDPLGGRDDDGPIFPVGRVDVRLPVQEQVLGIQTPDGQHVAFSVAQARSALEAGGDVLLAGVRVTMDAGGLRAELADGTPIASHQAFWFAWSQFHPDTVVWTPLS